MSESWHVYARKRVPETGLRGWVQVAWADDLATAQHLFMQACATSHGHLRLAHDDGSYSPDPGFDRSVIAERFAR